MRSLTDWFEIVWFRWKIVAIVTATIVALMAVYLIFAPRTYEASASLYFNKSAPDPLRNDEGAAKQGGNPTLDSEIEIVKSTPVVAHVIEKLTPNERKAYEAAWSAAVSDKKQTSFEDWMRGVLLKQIQVTAENDAQLIAITARARNGGEAAKLANLFAGGYLEAQRQLSTGPAQAYAKQLTTEMATARQAVMKAEASLSAFVKATGIAGGNLDSAAVGYQNIAVESASARAIAASTANTGGAAEGGLADALRTETIQRLNSELSTKSAMLSDMEASLGPNHPKMIAARAELDTIQSRLSKERAAATATFSRSRSADLAAANAAAAARASQLESAANSQRSQLVAMSSNLGKFQTLQQDLAAAQQQYNDLSAKEAQMRLRSNIPLANISQLDTAKVPNGPTSPKAGLLSMLAVLLGLAIGAGLAILLEYLNPRVRTLANVEKLIGVPVVARLSLPRETPRMLTDARAT